MGFYKIYKTPISKILIVKEGQFLKNIFFDIEVGISIIGNRYIEKDSGFEGITNQLDLYFEGKIKKFDIKLKTEGTDFQKRAWKALLKIPHGKTISYREQSILMNSPGSMRAVGNANGKNPIPIIIPCHRVIRNDGTLGGFSSGEDIKKELLKIEGVII